MSAPAQQGYTLIEVLIASTIFVVVLGIALGTLTSSGRFSNRVEAQTILADTGRSVAELIDREVREATGLRESDGRYRQNALPVTLVAPAGGVDSEGFDRANGLRTVRFLQSENSTVVTRIVFASQMIEVYQAKCAGATLCAEDAASTTKLLPAGIELKPFPDGKYPFRGVQSTNSPTEQPFIQYEFTLRSTSGMGGSLEQTIRGAMTSRAYR
ncbi:MAG: PilW family protein [Patescibacteria group bacterium]|jgi:prepilin-type N-terminal cleavage/methylation domain-containing protein